MSKFPFLKKKLFFETLKFVLFYLRNKIWIIQGDKNNQFDIFVSIVKNKRKIKYHMGLVPINTSFRYRHYKNTCSKVKPYNRVKMMQSNYDLLVKISTTSQLFFSLSLSLSYNNIKKSLLKIIDFYNFFDLT